jgi:hypothetical protein
MASEIRVEKQMVGIFWLVGGRLILDASPLSEAEPYGDCLTHRNSHIDYWTEQQRLGAVPHDVEYEEHPRGRVTYNSKAEKFYLLADRCILHEPATMARIMKAMNLPVNTIVDADTHYKCLGCNKSESQREAEEADWNL